MTAVEPRASLTQVEVDRLVQCEELISKGLRTFVEVGTALLEIRDSRLYRSTYATFEAYCQERWGFNRHRAAQLIGAADVVTNVTKIGLPAPTNEAQARELARVPEGDRAEVWQQAHERGNGKPTAATIAQLRVERTEPTSQPVPAPARGPVGRTESDVPSDGLPVAPPGPAARPQSEAVTEYLAADPGLQDHNYARAFMGALQSAGKLPLFDSERVGLLLDETEFRLLRMHADTIRRFADAAERARRGLRVINGGRA